MDSKINNLLYFGDALQYFFTHAIMNINQDSICINLMDYFHALKSGYALKTTLNTMIHNYIYTNNLEDPNNRLFFTLDDLFIKAFGDDIAADFYGCLTDNKRYIKFSIQDAIDIGLISHKLNTFQIIKQKYINFQLNPLNKHLFIINVNIYNCYHKKLSEVHSDAFISQLIDEFLLASEIYALYKLMNYENRTMNLLTFISLAIDHEKDTCIKFLLNDQWSRLLYAIVIQNYDMISTCQVDLRSNDNGAYRLACEIGNKHIIDSIRRTIIEKNWYEKQTFVVTFESLIGESNLPDIVYSYMRKLV